MSAMAFTRAQQKQVGRASPDRGFDSPKMERFTPDQLRAKVNIIGVSDVVRWAPECDYTDMEKACIEAALPRTKWALRVPELLAEVKALQADGLPQSAIDSIMRRG